MPDDAGHRCTNGDGLWQAVTAAKKQRHTSTFINMCMSAAAEV